MPPASRSRLAHVDDAARKRPLVYDKGGDRHYDFISAWIKSTRASDVQASLYYLAAMLEGGEDARFIVRRMIVLASEDIGNADPQALLVAVAAAQAVEHVGLPEARHNLAQATVYLARAPKSNASYVALGRAIKDVRERGQPAAAGRASLGVVSGRASARARARLRLPTRRPGRLRRRLPAGGAAGDACTTSRPASATSSRSTAGPARGSARRARSRRARRRASRSRSHGRGSGSPRRRSSESSKPDSATSSSARCASR